MNKENNKEINIKENLASNIAKYRKAQGLTQLELAERINYSDKAVSKWERAEAIPDLLVVKQLADIFGVTIDTLIKEQKKDKPKNLHNLGKKRTIIGLCAAGLVWLVATCCFAFIDVIIPGITHTWLFFIYALPISFLCTSFRIKAFPREGQDQQTLRGRQTALGWRNKKTKGFG